MKKLVIYYSYTGNTKLIANKIQEKLNCDILELTPKIPFSTNYDEVVKEYQSNNVNKNIEINDIDINLDNYDELIIGTPVWWYTMCPVISTFLKKYNLNNKDIYVFATNAGWLGHTFKDYEKLCNVKSSMNIVFDSNKLKTSTQELNNWIEKL